MEWKLLIKFWVAYAIYVSVVLQHWATYILQINKNIWTDVNLYTVIQGQTKIKKDIHAIV